MRQRIYETSKRLGPISHEQLRAARSRGSSLARCTGLGFSLRTTDQAIALLKRYWAGVGRPPAPRLPDQVLGAVAAPLLQGPPSQPVQLRQRLPRRLPPLPGPLPPPPPRLPPTPRPTTQPTL